MAIEIISGKKGLNRINNINMKEEVKMKQFRIISEKIIFSLLIFFCIINLSVTGCKKEFDPPNKTNIVTGNSETTVPVGTALKMKEYTDTMAKLWDPEAVLMEVNGINIGIDGFNQTNLSSSQWIFTYFSPKKPPMENSYIITFDGKGRSTWLQNGSSYQVGNNIANFSVDSDKAMLNADKAGLPQGKIYTVELRKNSKGMNWVIGSKLDEASSKYEIKLVNALTGDVVK
jgi:hypothetical protein